MPKYAVLDKDTIKNKIMPHLNVAKMGYVSKYSLVDVVNAILYKLKTRCQWEYLHIGHSFLRGGAELQDCISPQP